ncbi:AAA family ATPase [Streptomyces phaeochromogenes]|uniref:AAA family ATPase n=1 Tax=Streptomyces phaeochromogenes TaxID=1923 RepID=UPI00340DFAC8
MHSDDTSRAMPPEPSDDSNKLTESQQQNGVPRWWIYRGTGEPQHDLDMAHVLPDPPPWRRFEGGPLMGRPPADEAETRRRLGSYVTHPSAAAGAQHHATSMVNAALLLRRPLLVTGRPGTGKSTLAYRISRELRLGRVLRWHITSRTTVRSGLYEYDAIARVQDAAAAQAAGGRPAGESASPEPEQGGLPDLGQYLQLGPLGTALLPYAAPRVLLVDELDKSDLDLANDLLSIFEEGFFIIPELLRARRRHPSVTVMTDDQATAEIIGGVVTCSAFPLVVMTSNGDRDFPPAFLRRCLVLHMDDPDRDRLTSMVAAHFDENVAQAVSGGLIQRFLERRREGRTLSVDQLLNAVSLVTSERVSERDESLHDVVEALWHRLDGAETRAP